jgi:hypothetical protein
MLNIKKFNCIKEMGKEERIRQSKIFSGCKIHRDLEVQHNFNCNLRGEKFKPRAGNGARSKDFWALI